MLRRRYQTCSLPPLQRTNEQTLTNNSAGGTWTLCSPGCLPFILGNVPSLAHLSVTRRMLLISPPGQTDISELCACLNCLCESRLESQPFSPSVKGSLFTFCFRLSYFCFRGDKCTCSYSLANSNLVARPKQELPVFMLVRN